MDGKWHLPGKFSVILPKHTQISETKEFKRKYHKLEESKREFNSVLNVWSYRGVLSEPKWKDIDPENYKRVCTIDVNLSHLPTTKLSKPSGRGHYYRIDYEIVLLFGLTELKAVVAWKENGVEKRSPAKIIYDPDPTDND